MEDLNSQLGVELFLKLLRKSNVERTKWGSEREVWGHCQISFGASGRKPTNQQSLPSLRRAFSLYDQINLIDNVPDDQLRFQRYTETGFRVNGVDYEGSLLCVGNMLMSWAPTKFSHVNPDSLSMFQIVRPIPEILILGTGRNIEPIDPELRRFIRSTGMKLEAVDSRNAISTYNILNEEGRIVAAALLPYGAS